MRLPRNRRLRPLPVRTIVPNILTVLALCAGLTSIRLALQDRWELAVVAIIVAGIFDGLDGRLARLLKATSKFGAELDSLSDIVAFGVAPGVVLYTWSLHEAGGLGWIVVLVFGVSCALRLARFNIAIEDPDRPAFMANFFTGVPAPGGAGLALLPMMISFQGFESVFRLPAVCGPFLVGVALLMISRLPTYSFKRLRVRRDYVLPVLMLVGLLAALLVSYPWLLLTSVGTIYLASIPFSVSACRRLQREIKPAVAKDELHPVVESSEDEDENAED
jgi:CDP-diacylglycerol--serine O-phosphatidyltransferase